MWMEVHRDLIGALARFEQGWRDPIAFLGPDKGRIDYYERYRSWKKFHELGPRIIKDWWSIIQWDTDLVIGRELFFDNIPIGQNGNMVTGTIDKLLIRYVPKLGQWALYVSDYKTNAKVPTYEYLEDDLQFTLYLYATTRPEFWAQVPNGAAIQARVQNYPRLGEWVHLQAPKRMECGTREQYHYNRLAIAVDALADSVALRVFVPNISGESCRYCLAGETEIWTAEGVRPIKDVAGTTQRLLSRSRSGGTWVDAEVRSFGVQSLHRITLRRGKSVRTIDATSDHRWFVRTRKDPVRTESVTKVTDDLRPGDVLLATLPRPTIMKVTPSPIGIQAGVVFGDGCATVERRTSEVALHGAKADDLARYFAGHPSTETRIRGRRMVTVHGLPRFLKSRPDLNESSSYLLGWLMGYVATDGSVSADGSQVTLSSSSREDIELARTVAALLGIGTYNVNVSQRVGYGQAPTPLYCVQFISSTLPNEFLLMTHHADRFVQKDRSDERVEWTVVDVADHGRVDEVFCATVPEHANFTLEGWINTHNCEFRKLCGLPEIEEDDE